MIVFWSLNGNLLSVLTWTSTLRLSLDRLRNEHVAHCPMTLLGIIYRLVKQSRQLLRFTTGSFRLSLDSLRNAHVTHLSMTLLGIIWRLVKQSQQLLRFTTGWFINWGRKRESVLLTVNCCLLWIVKVRVKDKTYKRMSVWWKTTKLELRNLHVSYTLGQLYCLFIMNS